MPWKLDADEDEDGGGNTKPDMNKWKKKGILLLIAIFTMQYQLEFISASQKEQNR